MTKIYLVIGKGKTQEWVAEVFTNKKLAKRFTELWNKNNPWAEYRVETRAICKSINGSLPF